MIDVYSNSIMEFWDWFLENEKELRFFELNPDKYLSEILSKAKSIESELAFELEPPIDGVINMTISADGVRDLFPVVQEVVLKSPKIDGWNFIAFRQRVNKKILKELVLESGNLKIRPSEMKFYPIVEGNSLDLIIYLKGVNEKNYNQIAYNGLLIIDNILGEFDCVTKVRGYDFHELPSKEEDLKDLKPILDLPEFVDSFIN